MDPEPESKTSGNTTPSPSPRSTCSTSGGEDDPIPLNSICANCSVHLSAKDFVADFTLPADMGKRSVHQAIQLIFINNEANDPKPNALKFCCSCGGIFEQLLNSYIKFLRATFVGSYIHNLRYAVKVEPAEADEDNYDNSILESLSVTLHEGAYDEQNQHADQSKASSEPKRERNRRRKATPKDDGGTEVTPEIKTLRRSSFRTRKPTEHYQDQPTGRKKRKVKNISTSSAKESSASKPVNNTGKSSCNDSEFADDSSQMDDEDTSGVPNTPHPKKKTQCNLKACDICNEDLPPDTTLLEHKRLFHEFRFPCSQCDKKFLSRQGRGVHMRNFHLGQRKPGTKPRPGVPEEIKSLLHTTTYKCDSPGCQSAALQFDTFKEWVLHQEVTHSLKTGYDLTDSSRTGTDLVPISGFIRPCSQCGKKFKFETNLKTHLSAIHLKLRPYSCDICQKKFKNKQALDSHTEGIHSTPDASGFLCTLCGSTFKTKGGMIVHEKTHFGEAEVGAQCDICHQQFTTVRILKEHKIKAHTDEVFTCEHCQMTFKVKRCLDRHRVRQHFKKFIRDEICDLCGKGYALKQHLKEHLISFHKLTNEEALVIAKIKARSVFRILPNGDRVYPKKQTKPKTCDLCSRTYVRREQLFTHYMSVHGKTEEEAKQITGLESKRNLIPSRSEHGDKKKATAEPPQYFKL